MPLIGQDDLASITSALASRAVVASASFVADKAKLIGDQIKVELGTAFTRYLDRLVARYSFVKTVFYSDDPHFLYDFYVLQDLGNSRHSITDVDTPSLLSVGTRFLITGTGGSGKSFLMRHLLLDSIQTTDFIPIFVELRSINETELTLEDMLFDELDKHGLKIEQIAISRALKDGRFMLLLDGFDEVDPSLRDSVRRQINDLAERSPETRMFVSSRPEQERSGWHQFVELQVQPLNLEKIRALVSRLRMDEPTRMRFLADLEDELYKSHESFLSNPLLLTLMAASYRRNAVVPTRRHLFYSQVFDTLWNQHDAMKESFVRSQACGLQKDDFMDLFGAFSMQSYLDSRIAFSPKIAREYASTGAKVLSLDDLSPDDFVDDLVSATCMIIREGTDLRYVHRSFQEFFTAHFVQRAPSTIRQEAWPDLIIRAPLDSTLDLLYDMDSTLVESELLLPKLRDIKDKIFTAPDPHFEYLKFVMSEIYFEERNDDDIEGTFAYSWGWVRNENMNFVEFAVRCLIQSDLKSLLPDLDPSFHTTRVDDYKKVFREIDSRWTLSPEHFDKDKVAVKEITEGFPLLHPAMLEALTHAATRLEEKTAHLNSGLRSIFQGARRRT